MRSVGLLWSAAVMTVIFCSHACGDVITTTKKSSASSEYFCNVGTYDAPYYWYCFGNYNRINLVENNCKSAAEAETVGYNPNDDGVCEVAHVDGRIYGRAYRCAGDGDSPWRLERSPTGRRPPDSLAYRCTTALKCQAPTEYNEETNLCEVRCPVDKPWDDQARACLEPPGPNDCSTRAGNPIDFLGGQKIQKELVFQFSGKSGLAFSWLYNSFTGKIKSGAGYSVPENYSGPTVLHTESPINADKDIVDLPLDMAWRGWYTGDASSNWRNSHSYFVGEYTLPGGGTRLIAYRPNGFDIHFIKQGSEYVALGHMDWRLSAITGNDGARIGWILKKGDVTETYGEKGEVKKIEKTNGYEYVYKYSNQKLIKISDNYGNYFDLNYSNEELTSISANGGGSYSFQYDEGKRLSAISYPGEEGGVRAFLYEDDGFPNALTAIVDESGNIISSFAYDNQGRAIHTEHAGGSESVDIEYVDADTRKVTNALGKSTIYYFTNVNGGKRISSVSGEPSANCAASSKNYTYDDNGFVASETDWEGNVTIYARDHLGRELSRTEAAGTSEARIFLTEWHADFNRPAKITTPQSITEYSYDNAGRLLGKSVSPVANP